ncbi:MAG TPA: CaiB/BaiF CoA-transferase family protein, partial [Ramlibacter sp.]|nr:CaiB/BaiF CoA-transferase family protein [Ramlibacter sp.]
MTPFVGAEHGSASLDTLSGGALAGLRVLDLSRVLAGPWSTQLLGDFGADVVKVERPGAGDDTRSWGPPWLKDDAGQDSSDAAYYLCANRNKRSVTIDLACAAGQALVRQLAAKADILVENFKVGGLKAYGLDYESLKATNPRLIYCSVTGFGQTGPYAQRPGYDFLVQGMGGLMSLTGRADGTPGEGPLKAGVALTDILTGLYATVAILAALAFRERCGLGQHIDLALLDVQVATLANQASNYLVGGKVPGRMGNAHPNIVPYQDFRTADGYMIVTVGNDSQFASLCRALGRPQWADDERFATNAQRVAHRAVLVDLINGVTQTRSTEAWVAIMEAAKVPCGPINDLAGVFRNPQVASRGMKLTMEHPANSALPLVANPVKMS